MKQNIVLFLISAVMLMAVFSASANNINVTNIMVTGQNTTAGANNAANYSLV